MTINGTFKAKDLIMMGDSSGKNIGRLFEYNKIKFFLSSDIPFEQYCFFKFVFPDKLKLDSALQFLTGDGIFTPYGNGNKIPSSSYTLDIAANTLKVEGCLRTDYLTSRPIGELTFAFVLLPDYISDTNPIEFFAYSDNTYSDIIFEETKASGGGLVVTKEMLQPGHLDLIEFIPSSYYAFVKDVTYTVSIRPLHDCLPSHRIIISMPQYVKFDPKKGCTVTYTEAKCSLNPETNELTLTDVFTERTPGGSILKFIISLADNPIGARYAGDWGARTEGIFEDGKYFVVDGNDQGFSFDAKPGSIKSDLDYTEKKTFTEGTDAAFTFVTEHDIPAGGVMKITLPIEMTFPKSILDSEDPSTVLGSTATGGADE